MIGQTQESQSHTAKMLLVEPPIPPADFAAFWSKCFDRAMQVNAMPVLSHNPAGKLSDFELFDVSYFSTDGVRINGWVTIPRSHVVRRALVVGHGYGSCPEPTDNVPLKDAAYLWPCLRGLGKSRIPGIPEDPYYHVIYDIDKPDKYIIRGCVEDIWLAVTALEKIFPVVKNRIGMLGLSFSAGIGMLAAPWDERIRRLHCQVPTFGHHPLRMTVPSWGSAKSLQDYNQRHPDVLATLAYYDAANAAQFMSRPTHIAAALLDPVVAPVGQFAIYNALKCERALYVLEQGHSDYTNSQLEQIELTQELTTFFSAL